MIRAGPREGAPPRLLDSPAPKRDIEALMAVEGRFQLTARLDPARYAALVAQARDRIARRRARHPALARNAGADAPAAGGPAPGPIGRSCEGGPV
jgi:hypothetical protein